MPKEDELKAMAFSDGSIVLHNVLPGFVVEVEAKSLVEGGSDLGPATPIEVDQKELEKIKKTDLKKVKLEGGKMKVKEDKKNDSKDVPSPVQEL